MRSAVMAARPDAELKRAVLCTIDAMTDGVFFDKVKEKSTMKPLADYVVN